MVQCVRHSVLPRLKKDAGLPFFFPLKTNTKPLNEGLFFAQASGDKHG
ncbi:pyr operon leader peptide [Salmonella enterica subsp. enterica serovar Enteritidis]|nr:pyr operon leader peptide [Salmonella enterica subsp. enterica serovar Enteritidis]EDB5184337.1 pyr operon leader peptide [Salmonella enterica subsp. enterica serovar Enteritidis]